MKRTIATATALTMVALMLPSGTAAETATAEYFGTSGVRVMGQGIALMCPNYCLGDDLNPFPGHLGGAHMVSPSGAFYTSVVVSAQDDIWGSNAGLSVCFWNPDGDNICDDDDVRSGFACGTIALTDSSFASDFVTTWVYTVMITDDLEVCGGTAGTISADLF